MPRQDFNDTDGQVQRGVQRMLGKVALTLVALVIMAMGGWLVTVAVAQGVVETRLLEVDRRLEKTDATMERIFDRLQAIGDRVGVPPATRP